MIILMTSLSLLLLLLLPLLIIIILSSTTTTTINNYNTNKILVRIRTPVSIMMANVTKILIITKPVIKQKGQRKQTNR